MSNVQGVRICYQAIYVGFMKKISNKMTAIGQLSHIFQHFPINDHNGVINFLFIMTLNISHNSISCKHGYFGIRVHIGSKEIPINPYIMRPKAGK